VTIRGKLVAAIALTIIGPVVTIGVALAAFGSLSDHSEDVRRAGERQALALDLKFAVTDMNGWQTAYGYDNGRSRPEFEASVERTEQVLAAARARLREPRERQLLDELETAFDAFMELDVQAYAALQAGREAEVRRIFLGPEIRNFEAMARAADELAREEDRRAAAAAREFEDARTTARRELVAVGIGAAVVIVLLLLTAQDVVRLALERREP
jgi:methyl-accepting chemotaxis protein